MKGKITQKVIAERVGVSQATVSMVLNGKESSGISPETVKKILKVAKELNYTPKYILAEQNRKTGNIAYLVHMPVSSFLSSSYYHRFFKGIREETEKNNYDFFLVRLRKDDFFPNVLRRKKVDGIIVEARVSKEWINEVKKMLPVVLLNYTVERTEVDTVMPDNKGGIKKAIERLYELGHRRIGLFGLKPLYVHTEERLQGYIEGIREYGLPEKEEYIVLPERKEGTEEETEKMAEKALNDWKKLFSPPTAVVTFGDTYAVPLLKMAKKLKIYVPDDLSIVGYDNTEICRYTEPPLTSVNQPMEEMGRKACQLLFERIENPDLPARKLIFDVEIVERGSTGKIKKEGGVKNEEKVF